MAKYVIWRLVQAIPVLFLISLVGFALMLMAPGGPAAQFNQNPRISPAQVDAWLRSWCLARNPGPLDVVREYFGWLGVWNCNDNSLLSASHLPNFLPTFLGGGTNGVLHLDFGYSISQNVPVIGLILERLPATLILMGTAFVLWASIAIVVGVVQAVRRYSLFDQSMTTVSYVLYSLPTFWLGFILIFIFGVTLRWFPVQGIINTREAVAPFGTADYWGAFMSDPVKNILDIAGHLVLPVLTLIAVSIAGDSRFVRSAMLDSLHQDYVRTARSKGIPERRVIVRHAFRNALLPILTNLALEIAFLFSGAIVTEQVFSWPGMGRLFIEGLNARDYFLLMGIFLIGTVLVVVMNLVADVAYAVADPRIRYD